jgi:DNA-binding MarR family transcriptional regulator
MQQNPTAGDVQHLHTPDHPDTPDAPQHAWRHALRLAAASEQLIAQLRAAFGLSSNEMNALLLLHDGGSCSMTDLSRRIRLSRAALSPLVDRLESDGWLSRTRDANDRRRLVVAVTDRFEHELYRRTRTWRQRLQNLASASDHWPLVVDHVSEICHISERTAREYRDLDVVTRPGP